MINVQNLSKSIDGVSIVRDLSFDVEKGEILGFIGPNGAGKTTTLRMLACATAPSAGTARLDGFDLLTQDEEIRRISGYMPEVPPLYPFMRVQDYLRFMARLKGIPVNAIGASVNEVVDRCKLGQVTNREIGKLSKGFRQRTGLAQALLSRPRILLLDEPTASLDPEQIHESREIIRDYARDAAVMFSTHIMQEVRHLCHRIVVIKHGEIRYQEVLRRAEGEPSNRRSIVVRLRDTRNRTRDEILAQISALVQGLHPTAITAELASDASGSSGANSATDSITIRFDLADEDQLQSLLLKSLLDKEFHVREVQPAGHELEQTILRHMKD